MKLNSRIRILSAFLAMTLFLTACGSGEGTPNNKVDATENNQVTVEKEDNNVVTDPSDDTEVNGVVEDVEKEPTEEELELLEWQNYMLPNVKSTLNVRADMSTDSEIVGILEKEDRATVLEKGEEWSKIKSGNVEGYIKNEYGYFGAEALAYAKENFKLIATVTTDGLRMRQEMSTDSKIVKGLSEGDRLVVDKTAVTNEGWVAVKNNNATCYVSADYVTVAMHFGTAMSIEELREIERAEAEKKAKEEQAKKEAAANNAAVKEVDDLTLMAAIIYCEAGAEPYEAQLAVGAVIMNRLKSGRHGDTLYAVIYQKGQFGPAGSGKLARVIAQKKAKASCYDAARAALAGEDNTNGCTRFNDYNGTQKGLRFGGMVFW